MTPFDVLIVGAGWAGSVCAERLAAAGKRVLIIDRRDHIAGNAYDYTNDDGLLVHRYGAHVFHCQSAEVYDYVSRFTAWRPYVHRVLSNTSRGLVPVPINQTTLRAFDGDLDAAKAEIITPYTQKQWGPYADRLSAIVLARITTRENADDRYFTDPYQAMPKDGYTRLFARMLDHPNITIQLRTQHRDLPTDLARQVIYTGPIDEYFAYEHGRLPYRSARFVHTTQHGVTQAQPVGVVNYPAADVPFTRITEFKHLTGQTHRSTALAIEYPQADGDPYWPVPTAESASLYRLYDAKARQLRHVYFAGRLGSYRYLDQWQVIAQALKLSSRLLTEAPCAA